VKAQVFSLCVKEPSLHLRPKPRLSKNGDAWTDTLTCASASCHWGVASCDSVKQCFNLDGDGPKGRRSWQRCCQQTCYCAGTTYWTEEARRVIDGES